MNTTILQGDVRETLKSLPDNSVHCVVTSPPYWALRSYLPKGHPLKAMEIGSEPTPEAFIQTMVDVFREVRRVLHPSGTCWVNIGDSYAHDNPSGPQGKNGDRASRTFTAGGAGGKEHGLKPKDLCLIPERLAIALQADGWWVRSRIAWCKRSPMPESVTDRPTSAWEHIWLLTKSASYYYDSEPVRQLAAQPDRVRADRIAGIGHNSTKHSDQSVYTGGQTANLRNFWLLGPEPYSEAHFATFPTEIPKRAILAGTSARGCCPKCLAPWERLTETTSVSPKDYEGKNLSQPEQFAQRRMLANVRARRQQGNDHDNPFPPARTIGWQPTCECGSCDDCGESIVACKHLCCEEKGATMTAHEPIPCTVLDPFGGSGTTAAVAIELGRKAILCELNPNYIQLIQQRTNVTAGLRLA